MTTERLNRWGRGFMLAWDLLLVAACIQILSSGRELWPGANIAGTALLVAVGVIWTWYWVRCPLPPWGTLLAGLGIAVMLSLVALPAPPSSVTSLLIYAVVIFAAGFSWRPGLAAVVGVTLLAALIELAKGSVGAALALAANEFLVGVLAVGGRALINSYFELAVARDQIARLAVAEERLRFSRDLHDLLGHSLAVVVLKSEVVARRLPEGDSRAEVKEIAQVARRALEQVREAVAGYRRPDLALELANARSALHDAGIQPAFENTAGPLSPAVESLIGWAVREGVTNVVKHAQATRCRIKVSRQRGEVVLEILNDGAGDGDRDPGHGLRGMQERAAIMGGTVSATVAPGGEFKLEVKVPLGAEVGAGEALTR